jgi:hypothetical protein
VSGSKKKKISEPLKDSTQSLLGDKKKKAASVPAEPIGISLKFKRYIFDKTMAQ